MCTRHDMAFGSGPQQYPALVAGRVVTDRGRPHQCLTAVVYPADAVRLLRSANMIEDEDDLDDDTIEDDPGMADRVDTPPTLPAQTEQSPPGPVRDDRQAESIRSLTAHVLSILSLTLAGRTGMSEIDYIKLYQRKMAIVDQYNEDQRRRILEQQGLLGKADQTVLQQVFPQSEPDESDKEGDHGSE
jgi:hypothetical protein